MTDVSRFRWILPVLAGFALIGSPAWADPTPVDSAPADSASSSIASDIETLSVHDEPVREVIQALAEHLGLSVVMDETVDGSVSLVLQETDAVAALYEIVEAADLFAVDRQGIFYLSRVRCRELESGWIVESRGASLESVLRRLQIATGTTITYPSGDGRPTYYSLGPAPLAGVLRRIADDSGLTLHREGSRYLLAPPVREQPAPEPSRPTREVTLTIEPDSEGYCLEASMTSLEEILRVIAGEQALILDAPSLTDRTVSSLSLKAPRPEILLEMLARRFDVEIVLTEDVLAAAPTGRLDLLRPYLRCETVSLSSTTVATAVPALTQIPGLEIEFTDEERNAVSFCGAPGRVEDGLAVIRRLQGVPSGRRTINVPVFNRTPDELVETVRRRFPSSDPLPVDHNSVIAVTAPEETIDEVVRFIGEIDVPQSSELLLCRFIDPTVAIDALATATPELHALVAADRHHLLVEGPPGAIKHARTTLEEIDRPRGQIRFDLCIVQFQESDGFTRSIDLDASYTDSDVQTWSDSQALSGRFDDLLSLRFDLVSALGYGAALALTGELSDNTANLLTNTSLHALDGETVHLENAGTFRYRDRDPDAEDSELGITREIDSGLTIDLEGTIHRDNSISVAVSISISKQGVDTSAAGNPPPTSRKVIDTVIRVTHGEPLIIGGLLQEETDESDRRIPILGRIPVLGRFFGSRSSRNERTEIVLYLSAFVEPDMSAEIRAEEQETTIRELIGATR